MHTIKTRPFRVPFQTHHPENQGIFHNQSQNLCVRADSIRPYTMVLLTLSKKLKFICNQKIPHLSAARQNPKKNPSPIR
jgi:hypothetical protein